MHKTACIKSSDYQNKGQSKQQVVVQCLEWVRFRFRSRVRVRIRVRTRPMVRDKGYVMN